MSSVANPFTDLVGCRLSLQQAAMGGVTTSDLVVAVAREGALGMIPASGLSPDQVVERYTACVAAAGAGARIGVSFLMPFLDRSAFEAAASIAPVVECFYADPDPKLVELAKNAGALVAWQVGSLEEASTAAAAGCDLLVVQGREAGGHVRGVTKLLDLVAQVGAREDLPLVAAGGVGTRDDVVATLDAGADAVRIGTRLLATFEADVHPTYAEALLRADSADTVLTQAFSMGWPDAPHRVLRHCITASDAPAAARSPLPPTRGFDGEVGSAALYAGKSVAAISRIEPAASVIRELMQ